MTVNKAVKELRGDESRQVFATRLGMSMTAVYNYEHDRFPDARALFAFYREAVAKENGDAEQVFVEAIRETIGAKTATVQTKPHLGVVLYW